MTRPTEAQHSDAKTSLALATTDFAEVRHHIAVARELRAQYMAQMIRSAFRVISGALSGALSRVRHLAPARKEGDARTA